MRPADWKNRVQDLAGEQKSEKLSDFPIASKLHESRKTFGLASLIERPQPQPEPRAETVNFIVYKTFETLQSLIKIQWTASSIMNESKL